MNVTPATVVNKRYTNAERVTQQRRDTHTRCYWVWHHHDFVEFANVQVKYAVARVSQTVCVGDSSAYLGVDPKKYSFSSKPRLARANSAGTALGIAQVCDPAHPIRCAHSAQLTHGE